MVLETLWQEFLKILCAEVGSRVVETWFKAVTLVRWDAQAKIAYLKAPNTFVQEWISTHYQHLFKQHLARLLHEVDLGISFVALGEKNQQASEYSPSLNTNKQGMVAEGTIIASLEQVRSRTQLDVMHQFDSFIVGPHNSFAFAAACAVTKQPGLLYNPLVICGASGLGKTHLLQAIGNYIKQDNTKAQVVYQSADRFVHEFVSAARSDRVFQFETKYKSADVLLVDDIQYISHKAQTQEIFFSIFTTLHQAAKQIVFTSDVLPRNINGFPDRIRSRLESGLVIDIQSAPYEARYAILERKSMSYKTAVPKTVLEFLAAHVDSNIRELEGSLMRVLAFASLTQQEVSLDLAQKVLAYNNTPKKSIEAIDLSTILKTVAQHFEYTCADLLSSRRTKELAFARHVAMYLMKQLTSYSLREIAEFFHRKDHSTVIHGVNRISDCKKADSSLALKTDNLLALLVQQLEKSITSS